MSTDAVDHVRALIERLAPGQTKDQAAALTLSDAGYALTSGFSQVFGVTFPTEEAPRAELAGRCLELCLAWVPRLSQTTLKQLDWRNNTRKTFRVDLAARKRVKRKRPEYLDELTAFDPLPPLTGYNSVGACFIQKSLGIGELGVDLKVPAKRGVWLGYHRLHEAVDAEPGFRHEILVVHAESRTRVEELRAKRKRSKAFFLIDGGTLQVADAACAGREEFREALIALAFGETAGEPEQIVGGRYIAFSLDGDGRGTAYFTREDNEAVLAILEC